MKSKRTIGIWILSALVAIQFIGAGASKVAGTVVLDNIHEGLGAPIPLLIAIGVIELACAALVLWPKTRPYAAAVLTGIVATAFTWHLVAGDYGGAPGAFVALLLAGGLAWLTRPNGVRLARDGQEAGSTV